MSIKVSFNEKSIKDVEDRIKQSFEKVIANPEMMNDIGEIIVKDIQYQTRRGLSIPTNRSFKALKDSTVDMRKRYAQNTDTHETFSPKRSNLTITGKLLSSLSFERLRAGVIQLYFKGIHNAQYRYKLLKGSKAGKIQTIESRISNEELAEHVQQIRPFVGVRDAIKKRIKIIVLSYLRRSSRVLKLFEE